MKGRRSLFIGFPIAIVLGIGILIIRPGRDDRERIIAPRASAIVTNPDDMGWGPSPFCPYGKDEDIVDAKLLRINRERGDYAVLMKFRVGVKYPRHYHANGWHEMYFLSGGGLTPDYEWSSGTLVISPQGVAMGPFIAAEETVVFLVWHGQLDIAL